MLHLRKRKYLQHNIVEQKFDKFGSLGLKRRIGWLLVILDESLNDSLFKLHTFWIRLEFKTFLRFENIVFDWKMMKTYA